MDLTPKLGLSLEIVYLTVSVCLITLSYNIFRQLLPRGKNEPPLVFHIVPFIGNAVDYGKDPYGFLTNCRKKYGDIFTFVLLGKRITCYLGLAGNEFILNGTHQDLNAEEIYAPLTTPVFGAGVVYDCPNAKLMEQKKLVKFGLSTKALECHVPLIEKEVIDYVASAPDFVGIDHGTVNVNKFISEITIFTAGRALQGEEVRKKLTNEFASLYHDLDMGLQPINFLLPWAPLPHNRRRDNARHRMREIYMEIISKRRASGTEAGSDMIWNLMNSEYKDGHAVPDTEIAHMMIALLMAGQHTSASAGAWILLHLAARPDIAEELYDEQVQHLGTGDEIHEPLQLADLEKLPLLRNVIKETLRLHSAVHSVLRKVKRPIHVPGTSFIVTADKVLLASPLITAVGDEYFSNAKEWDPHRWNSKQPPLAADDGDFEEGESYSRGGRSPYLPFGAGRHRCVGERFAYLNLGVITATLVRHFRFHTLDGRAVVPETDYSSLLSRPMESSVVRWTRRSSGSDQ